MLEEIERRIEKLTEDIKQQNEIMNNNFLHLDSQLDNMINKLDNILESKHV